MAAEGVTPFQQAVAWAMTSPARRRRARYHTGGEAGPADTVYLGVYRRAAIERVGGYDESYLRAEDWELNHRIRQAGGLIWFQPGPAGHLPPAGHAARPRQAVLPLRPLAPGRRPPHPGTVNLRYLAPPVVTGSTPPALSSARPGSIGAVTGAAAPFRT